MKQGKRGGVQRSPLTGISGTARTRKQLFGLNTWDAYQNVRSEGLLMLYRGVKPPLLQAAVSKSIMFGLYNWYDEMLVARFGDRTGIHLLAAGLSGTTEAVLAPFEVRVCVWVFTMVMSERGSWLTRVIMIASANAAPDAKVQQRNHGRVRCDRALEPVWAPRALPWALSDPLAQRTREHSLLWAA